MRGGLIYCTVLLHSLYLYCTAILLHMLHPPCLHRRCYILLPVDNLTHLALIVGIEPAFKLPLDLAYRAIAVQALISRGLGVLVVALRMQLWGTAGGAAEVWRGPISDEKVSTTKHWTRKHVLRAVSRVYKLRAASAIYYYQLIYHPPCPHRRCSACRCTSLPPR
jgi:hypothetical protein